MDSGLLADFVERMVADRGIDSVTVVRNGYVVLDTVVYPFPEDTSHIIHSCTKSVVGTLIGIAIDRGLLAGVDVPVVELLAAVAPETIDDLKASMTVEDLLTMSAGLECRDSYLYDWRGLVEMQASDDWSAHVLALPMVEEPGARFEYCNGSSFLLSAILSEVTGKPASEFATEVLFEPLGITDFFWPASPGGITVGWGELVLRPSDMAKIGYLYLRNGEWDGDQLVPHVWIETATAPQIHAGTLSDTYGYQWWVDGAGYVMAQGFGGQYIVVVPDHDLVVAFNSGLVGERHSMPEELTAEYVLPAVSSDHPLPPDLDAQARLATAVTSARSGPESAIVEMPEIAATVDGVRYDFRPNDAGNTSFTIRFGDNSALLATDGVDGLAEIEVGMDGRFVIDEARPVALRGAWRDDNTFVIEYQVIGQVERGTLEFTFEDDVAEVTAREPATGTIESSTADRAN
jgi:CubicO group peptidase (beta-lactamase class C family)